MGQKSSPVDKVAFSRVAHLFEAKRQVLPKEAVAELARDVVQHVARPRGQEGRQAHQFESIAPAPEAVARLCDLLIQPTAAEALALVETEQARGVTRRGIIYGHLAPAARLLGDRWEEDAITFLDVTRGAGHLYALIRALRSDAGALRMADDQHSALFASTPGKRITWASRLPQIPFGKKGGTSTCNLVPRMMTCWRM